MAVLVLSALAIFTVAASAEEGDSSIYTVHPTDPGANFTTVQAAKTIYVDDDFIDDPPNHKWNTIQKGVDDATIHVVPI